jgi:hypothetical protein
MMVIFVVFTPCAYLNYSDGLDQKKDLVTLKTEGVSLYEMPNK